MPVPSTPFTRAYSGTAVPTYLVTFGLGSNSTGTFTVNSMSTWIDVKDNSQLGQTNPFVIAVGVGLATEEKMLVKYVNSTTLQVQVRNYDNYTSSGTDWGSGYTLNNVIVAPVWSAVEAVEANKAVVATSKLGGVNTAAPSLITSLTGSAGTSPYAATIDHQHQLPATLVTDIITQSYINGALTDAGVQAHANATYINNSLTDAGVQAHVPSSYVAAVFPAARAYSTASQVLTTSTLTTVTVGTSDYTKNGATIASNAITVPVAGVYRISGYIHWSSAPAGNWYFRPNINGSAAAKGLNSQYANYPSGSATGTNLVIEYLLAANDAVSLSVFTAAAGTIDGAALTVSLVTY